MSLWLPYTIDRSIIPMVSRMVATGMPVSVDALHALRPKLKRSQDQAYFAAAEIAGFPFNPGSSDQVAAIIHGKHKVPVKYKTDGGKPSTKEAYLAVYAADYPTIAPLVTQILEYRKYDQLISTFIDPIVAKAVDGWVHYRLNIAGTSTSRLSSSDPNFQNIPTRDVEGQWIRDCFVAPEGYSFVSNDLSQIELRCAAHISQDPALLAAYRTPGTDLHAATAMLMFGKSDGIWRYTAKTINFAILYGISAEGLYKQLVKEAPDGHWAIPMCQGYLDRYFATHPGIVRYIDQTRAHLRRYGYVEDMFGGRRTIPKVYAASARLVEEALREGTNLPVQGSASRILKLQMAAVDSAMIDLKWYTGNQVRPLLQIHDDLVFLVHDDLLHDAAATIKGVMEDAYQMSVPILVTTKVGKSWGSLKELEEMNNG